MMLSLGKGATHPQARPTLSSLPASSSWPRWPPLEEAQAQHPPQQQRAPAAQPREYLGNYADLQTRTIRARHKEIIDRICKGEQIREEWVSMICDPEFIRDQEQSGQRDPEVRPKKSSICRYFADNRGCNRTDRECHFKHVEWPTEIRDKMLRRTIYKGPEAEEARRRQREHKAQDRAAQHSNAWPRPERVYERRTAQEEFPPFQNPVVHREVLPPNTGRNDENIEIRRVGYMVNQERQAQAHPTPGWSDTAPPTDSAPPLGFPPPLPPPTTQPPQARQGGGTAGPAHAPPQNFGLQEGKGQRQWWDPPQQQQQYYPQLPAQQRGQQQTAPPQQQHGHQQGKWTGNPRQAGQYQHPMTHQEAAAHADNISASWL